MAVIQTQIILAIIGAIVMLVVGSSLARAFGIVGAAGLIRYRAKVDDPKDASVMLATLVLGLASGVGLYLIALFSTAFVLAVLWVIESMEPEAFSRFDLSVTRKEMSPRIHADIERVLRRYRIRFDLRETTADSVSYEVVVPLRRDTQTVTEALAALDSKQTLDVKWDRKKDK
jgi:uncharacterized membrane protein YhiD involved in acid resistance